MSEKKNKILRDKKGEKLRALLGIAGFILISAAACLLIGVPMIRFASEPERFRQWIYGYGLAGGLIFMAAVFFQVVFAVIPGEPLETFGGFAFGAIEGTLLCMIATALGSLAVFMLVRRFGMRVARVFFSEEKLSSLGFLKVTPKRNFLFLIIFMLPGTPKDLLCYYAGLTDMRLSSWMLISTFGRLPSVISSTVGGSALGTESYLLAAIVFGATLLVSAAGLLIYNRICAHHGNTEDKDKVSRRRK